MTLTWQEKVENLMARVDQLENAAAPRLRNLEWGDKPPGCTHPFRAVYWNPYNQVVQCHRCGEVLATRPVLASGEV